MEAIARRKLMQGGAALAVAAAVPVAAKADQSELLRLIQAHRTAWVALDQACHKASDLEEAWRDKEGWNEVFIPSVLGGGYSGYSYDACKELIEDRFNTEYRGLDVLDRVAPDLAKKAEAVFKAKEKEDRASLKKLFGE
jgi:hypothetical protein